MSEEEEVRSYWDEKLLVVALYPHNAFGRLSNSLLGNQLEYNKTKQETEPRIKMKFKKIKTSEILDMLEDGEMVALRSCNDNYTIYKMIKFPDGELKFFEQAVEESKLVDDWSQVEEIEFYDLLCDEWYKASV